MECRSMLHDIDWYQLLIHQNSFFLLDPSTILTSSISLIAYIYVKMLDMRAIHL
jgi:hypothetical protein